MKIHRKSDRTACSSQATTLWKTFLFAACAVFSVSPLFAQDPFILVGTNKYSAYRTDLAPGDWVYMDADSASATPVRATQRSLGYREVDYKSALYPTLYFNPVVPATNGVTVTYDYSAQANKTNLVGFWVSKDVPIIIGPDGNPYTSDGHHTTAGYLAPASPIRLVVPGKNRVIFGHIQANFYDAQTGPQPVTDAWWLARAVENRALLYGPEGDQLTQPGEPNYSELQPILPSVLAMPVSPSNIATNGLTAMAPSPYRSLAWGMADAVVVSATSSSGGKIAGFKKSAPGSSVDINFVEFFWADYLRRRVVWNDTLTGSPLGSTNGDANLVAAPLSFFAATANAIALGRSEVYRDEYGRGISDYTNATVFPPNTVNWAAGSISNGLAAKRDTYHLFLRDDSTVVGAIQPSALSTNILHIDTVNGMVVTQALQNIQTVIVNGGGTLKISWKDSTVKNTTLQLLPGSGAVTITGVNFVGTNTILGGGTLSLEGILGGNLQVTNGLFQGSGTVNGAVTTSGNGTLAPGPSIGTLGVNGSLVLNGVARMEINKGAGGITNDRVTGISALTYGGTLALVASGDSSGAGDSFKLFDAANYSGAFAAFTLPVLDSGLSWDSSRLIVDGTISVISGTSAARLAAQPSSQTSNEGTTVILTGGAVGSLPIFYQWQFNEQDLPGQTNTTLVLSNLQKTNQGSYRLIAQNTAGSVASDPAKVNVTKMLFPNRMTIGVTINGWLIQFLGTRLQNYVVQEAGTLSGPWSDLSSSLPADSTGLMQFEDTTAPLPVMRFYRTRSAP